MNLQPRRLEVSSLLSLSLSHGLFLWSAMANLQTCVATLFNPAASAAAQRDANAWLAQYAQDPAAWNAARALLSSLWGAPAPRAETTPVQFFTVNIVRLKRC